MKIYSLQTLVNIARNHTIYYKELYHNIPEENVNLIDLPPVDLDSYWKIDPIKNANYIFTEKIRDGFIYASSGSTGLPKYTAFSKQEWMTFSQIMGQLLWRSKLFEDGDIIANLASVGNLLSSFLTVHDGLLSSIADCVELPLSIATTTTPKDIVEICQYLKATTIIGLSFNLIDIAYYVKKNKIKDFKLKKIIYGGEILHKSQLDLIQNVFPEAIITPCVYSSNDAGLIGYWDETCLYNELRSCEPYATIEIIDPYTNKAIHEPYKEGIILATNFTKILMPAIRYPVGDKGMWVDTSPVNRKFIITGRIKTTEIKLKNVGISTKNLLNLVNILPQDFAICRHQLDVYTQDKKHLLVLKLGWAGSKQFTPKEEKIVEDALYAEIPELHSAINKKELHPIQIKFVELDEIKPNVGPGKHKQMVDHR